MSVTANKLGKEGIALSVVSSAFQRAAKDIVERFEAFGKAITTVSGLVADNQLGLGFGRLQVEMLEFFTAEAIASIASFGEIENSQRSHELLADTRMITDLARDYFVSVSKNQAEALYGLQHFKIVTDSLRNIILSLDLIRLGGRLEGSRTVNTEEAFRPYVEEMVNFIAEVEEPVTSVSKITTELIHVFEQLHGQLEGIAVLLVEIDMLRYRVPQKNMAPQQEAS